MATDVENDSNLIVVWKTVLTVFMTEKLNQNILHYHDLGGFPISWEWNLNGQGTHVLTGWWEGGGLELWGRGTCRSGEVGGDVKGWGVEVRNG